MLEEAFMPMVGELAYYSSHALRWRIKTLMERVKEWRVDPSILLRDEEVLSYLKQAKKCDADTS